MKDQAKKIGTKEFNSTGGRVGAMMFGDFRKRVSAINTAILSGSSEQISPESLPAADDWKIAFGAIVDIFSSFKGARRSVELTTWLYAHGLSIPTLKVMLLSYPENEVMSIFYVASIVFLCAGSGEYAQLTTEFPPLADNNTNGAKALMAARNMADLMSNGGELARVAEYELMVGNLAVGTDRVISTSEDLLYKLEELSQCTDMEDAIRRANEIVLAAAVNGEFLEAIIGKLAEATQQNINSLLIPTISNALFTYVIRNYGQLDQDSLSVLLENLFKVVSYPLISMYLAKQNPKHIKFVFILRVLSEVDLENTDTDTIVEMIDSLDSVDLNWTTHDLAQSLDRLRFNLQVLKSMSFNLHS